MIFNFLNNFFEYFDDIWPIQDDRMNMTKKFEHDQKDHTDKH